MRASASRFKASCTYSLPSPLTSLAKLTASLRTSLFSESSLTKESIKTPKESLELQRGAAREEIRRTYPLSMLTVILKYLKAEVLCRLARSLLKSRRRWLPATHKAFPSAVSRRRARATRPQLGCHLAANIIDISPKTLLRKRERARWEGVRSLLITPAANFPRDLVISTF